MSIHAERSGLTSLEGIPASSDVEVLCLQENRLAHFYGMPSFPKLRFLHADGNRITSFLGMSHQPCIEILTMEGNPICQHPHFRIMALLACGDTLRIINYRIVSEQERRIAESLGGTGGWPARCLCLGWMGLEIQLESIDFYSALSERLLKTYAEVPKLLDPATSFGFIFRTSERKDKSPTHHSGPTGEGRTGQPTAPAGEKSYVTLDSLRTLKETAGYKGPRRRMLDAQLDRKDTKPVPDAKHEVTQHGLPADTALLLQQSEVGALESVCLHRLSVSLRGDGEQRTFETCATRIIGATSSLEVWTGDQCVMVVSLVDAEAIHFDPSRPSVLITGLCFGSTEDGIVEIGVAKSVSMTPQQKVQFMSGVFKVILLFRSTPEELTDFYRKGTVD
jgi:hypothetical protein